MDKAETPLNEFLARVLAFAYRGNVEKSFAVHNPATGAHIADVPDRSAADTHAAIARAAAAMPAWAAKTAKERGAILRNWHAQIVQQHEMLAQLLTLEMGKPIAEARGEILYGCMFIEWFAEEGKRLYGDVIPSHGPGKRGLVLKQPIGVVGAITPWNFPSGMITRKVSPALAAGCTIVIKPAEDTPLSALALAMLAEQAGFPDDVMTILSASHAAAVAGALTSSPIVRKISFTGSTRVGKILMEQCAGTLKKLSLELGGNAPFIVFDDADLEQAVAAAIAVKFRNAGQTCVSANRFYVQRGVLAAFQERYGAAIRALRVGDGMAADSNVGPLINAAARSKVEALVADALAKGAAIQAGGDASVLQGNFYPPTLLSGITPAMDLVRTEIFGPVAALQSFDTEDEVIARANDTAYGLAAYVWARDLGRVWRVSEKLEYGMVAVNEILAANEAAPFGGVKESGFGREGSRYGLEDFTEMKYVSLGGLDR